MEIYAMGDTGGRYRRSGAASPLPAVEALLIVLVAGLLTTVYLALPTDAEELNSTLLGSVFMWATILDSGQPLWTPLLGLGTELPFRFGLFVHPFGPLFAILPPYEVLGAVVFMHLAVAGLFFLRLATCYLVHRWWRLAMTLSFLATPSIIQPLLVDDWLTNFVTATMTPVLLYAVYRLAQGGGRREMAVWGLTGGTACGVSVATGFPVVQVILAVLFYVGLRLSRPRTSRAEEIRSFLRFAGLIGGTAALIGAAQLYSLYHFVQLSPPGAARFDHPEPPFGNHVLSYLVRAVLIWNAETYPWRSAWFGTLAGLAALVGMVVYRRRREARGLIIPFAVSLALMFIPPHVLGDLITNTWAYRNGVDLFGLLLGGWAMERFFASDFFRARWRCAGAVPLASGAQIALMVIPVIALVALKADKRQTETWSGYDPRSFFTENVLLASLPEGRVALTPEAHVLMQANQLVHRGLALNTAVFSGRPSINMQSRGVSQDMAFPDSGLLNGRVVMSREALGNPFLRRFWAVSVAVSRASEAAASQLGPVVEAVNLRNGDGIAVHVPTAASAQVAVLTRAVDVAALPRLAGCPHGRLLCRDLEAVADRIDFAGSLQLTNDAIAISLPASPQERFVLLPFLWNDGLRAQTAEGAPVAVSSNGGLLQVALPAGAATAVVTYDGGIRSWLYAASGAALALACGVLLIIPLRRLAQRRRD